MRILFITILTTLSLFAMTKKQDNDQNSSNYTKIDDWDYNATIHTQMIRGKKNRAMPMATMSVTPSPMMKMSVQSLGLSVGGAKDSNNFYENIKNGYIPKIDAITYEGTFYDHYFQTVDEQSCEQLFCPKYETITRINPYTNKSEFYLSVGLNSNLSKQSFSRKLLNIVVVLDISGSMSSAFNRYYYDKFGKKIMNKDQINSTKMQIANESLVEMIDHLVSDDQLGIVLFDNNAYNAKPLRVVKKTDIKATKKHILDLKSRGGTNWSAGYKRGLTLFESLESKFKNSDVYENRIIFLTDAMPNQGELKKEGLFGLVDLASKKGIYTTFIGIGVDFNNNLVEAVSKIKGANYYSVHSAKEFKQRLDNEFDYMVTPIVFDLKLTLVGGEIEAVYGSPEADKTKGRVLHVNTLFPTPTQDGASKGGVILIKVKDKNNLKLTVSYNDRKAKTYEISKNIKFTNSADKATQKAILLSDYVTLMKNWILDSRADCNDKVKSYPHILSLEKRCMIYPSDRPTFKMIYTWEKKSCSLKVSAGYKKLFSVFLKHFKDPSFAKEIETIKELISLNSSQTKDGIIDDWNSNR